MESIELLIGRYPKLIGCREDLLRALELLSQGFRPTKYEIREPSLQEIYHAKIGGQMK